VVPPRVIAPNTVDTDLVNGQALLGCRVPTIIVSPFARGNPANPTINSLLYDHTSVLKMIEWRWNLPPLTARDASNEIANLALALNFSSPNPAIPALPLILEPVPEPCVVDDVFTGYYTNGAPIGVNAPTATQLADTSVASGADEEVYDFYLMLQSDLMQGWPLPAGLIEA
jgi:phospholipase C